MSINILEIGQCGFDGPRMERLFRDELKAGVDRADTAADTKKFLKTKQYSLLLINRVLAADKTSGLDLLRDLIKDGIKTPIMLVSDRDDAQEAAVAAGAVRGFGKADLFEPQTLELIKQAAGGA